MQKRDSDGETLLILIVDFMEKAAFRLKGKENVRLGGRKKMDFDSWKFSFGK